MAIKAAPYHRSGHAHRRAGARVRDIDASALRHLRERGDRAPIPRPMRIWIYGTLADLRVIAPRLAVGGWQDTEPRTWNDTHMILAEREQDASDAAMDAMVAEITRAIAGTDAVFDGWETQLEIGQ